MTKPLENDAPRTTAGRLAEWLRDRLALGGLVELAARKRVPIHRHSWLYLLGGAAFFLFLLQVASGCLLMLYYQPTEDAAYESVQQIMTAVPYGWLIRSVHVWGAHLFLAVAVAHLLTTLWAAAYRPPRELTWVSGTLLLAGALGFGFSGYLLPWNELSYYATRVGTALPASLPGVGPVLVHVLRGGDQVSGATITRFYAAHVFFLPVACGALLALHLLLVQLHGLSLPVGRAAGPVREQRPFFSEFLLLEACGWLPLFGLIVSLAVLLPAELGVRADPLQPAPAGIKPEWYFLFMFQTLKYVPEWLGVCFFALLAVFLVGMPFCDRSAARGVRSRWLSAVCLGLVLYAAVFEILAWLAPGSHRPPEPWTAETYRLSSGLVSLGLLWAVIGVLLYGLRQLLMTNTRLRRLREAPDSAA